MAYTDKDSKHKRFVTLKKPKHAEEYSTKENLMFQPWKVTLKVELDEDKDPIDYDIFLRAKTPDDAQATAYSVFWHWTHRIPFKYGAIPSEDMEYPRVCTSIPSEAIALTEDQWNEFLKESNYYPGVKMGNPPMVFRYVKPFWDVPSGSIIKPGAPNIIVPDKSAIEKVEKSKNKK